MYYEGYSRRGIYLRILLFWLSIIIIILEGARPIASVYILLDPARRGRLYKLSKSPAFSTLGYPLSPYLLTYLVTCIAPLYYSYALLTIAQVEREDLDEVLDKISQKHKPPIVTAT